MFENLNPGVWANQTTLHPIGLAALVVFGLSMLLLPRRYAIVPMILVACFLGPAQRIVVFTLDFNMLRVMVLFGWLRLMLRGEATQLTWKWLDTVILLWAISGTLAMMILYATMNAFVYRLGFMFDAAGMYFLFRFLLRDWRDIEAIVVAMAIVSVPVALSFMVEKITGRNGFSVFGGVPDYTLVRNGVRRCQGAFAHPILAGAFWAALLPLFASLWFRADWRRVLAPVGVIASLCIIGACSSTTPLGAVVVGIVALTFYPLRHTLVWVRWAGVGAVVMLHLAMARPIWHLLTRIDLANGSTGWYRYKLIDDFVNHFSEWWLVGTSATSHWWQWGSNDITNQYVLEGVSGGLLTLLLFVLTIVLAFRGVGRFEKQVGRSRGRRIMAWSIGVALFIHCVIFVGVSYFGQSMLLWYLTLAMIGSLSPLRAAHPTRSVLSARDIRSGMSRKIGIRARVEPASEVSLASPAP